MSKTLILEEVHYSDLEDDCEYLLMIGDWQAPIFQSVVYEAPDGHGCRGRWILINDNNNTIELGKESTIFEAPSNGSFEDDTERADEDIIEDGFGSAWSIICPKCKERSMSVVRPSQVQCDNCE